MIRLECTGKCQSCELLELEIFNLYAGDEIVDRQVRCRHEDTCRRMEEHLREELRKEEARREAILQDFHV